jgi:hypothetical protein
LQRPAAASARCHRSRRSLGRHLPTLQERTARLRAVPFGAAGTPLREQQYADAATLLAAAVKAAARIGEEIDAAAEPKVAAANATAEKLARRKTALRRAVARLVARVVRDVDSGRLAYDWRASLLATAAYLRARTASARAHVPAPRAWRRGRCQLRRSPSLGRATRAAPSSTTASLPTCSCSSPSARRARRAPRSPPTCRRRAKPAAQPQGPDDVPRDAAGRPHQGRRRDAGCGAHADRGDGARAVAHRPESMELAELAALDWWERKNRRAARFADAPELPTGKGCDAQLLFDACTFGRTGFHVPALPRGNFDELVRRHFPEGRPPRLPRLRGDNKVLHSATTQLAAMARLRLSTNKTHGLPMRLRHFFRATLLRYIATTLAARTCPPEVAARLRQMKKATAHRIVVEKAIDCALGVTGRVTKFDDKGKPAHR